MSDRKTLADRIRAMNRAYVRCLVIRIDRLTDRINRFTRTTEAWTERQRAKRTRRGK